MLRGILGIVVGTCLWGVLWQGYHAIMMGTWPAVFPADGAIESVSALSGTLGYSVLLSLAAGYVTAWMAQRHPMRFVMGLGVLQLAIGILVQSQFWTILPVWYHVIFLVLLVPGNLVGGWARCRHGGGMAVATA